MLALILWSWIGSFPAEAAILIRDPGCYRVSGTFASAQGHELKLRINEGTRSQEEIRVAFEGTPSGKTGEPIQLDLVARKRGDVRGQVFEAVPSSLRVLKGLPADLSMNWKWLAGPGEGSCPR